MEEAVSAGLSDLGENRVQAAEQAVAWIGGDVQWHLVGHLQRNKVGRAVGLFDRIHSVDTLELAQLISRRAEVAGRRLPVLVQVNVSREASKHGVAPEALERLVEGVVQCPGIVVDGLMSIGPPVESGAEARPYFAATRELRDQVARKLGLELPELSMGMSADYEVAVEEGSTMVRVGQALFGPRGKQVQ